MLLHSYLKKIILILLTFSGTAIWAFPENVRQGYGSCQSCHISPSGGGILTDYGKETSVDFLSTWSQEGEGNLFHGSIGEMENFKVGGDFRALAIQKDNNVYHYSRGFPMQADVELAYTPNDEWAIAATFGSYDGTPDSRRHYLIYKPNENWFLRGGLFATTFGLQIADHSASIRNRMNFNQGQETYNLEVGYTNEQFEIIFDAILGKQGEGISREQGVSSKFSYLVGERSVIGVSVIQAENEVWRRLAISPHSIIGFSTTLYLLAQTAWETKTSVVSNDPSLPDHTNLHSYMKLGWEVYRGFHVFAGFDDSHSVSDNYLARRQAYGPGIQWFPRPHFELEGRIEKKLDRAFSDKFGDQMTLLIHYYL